MTSLIKNQVLKHLTKFFKNLAPEQLQLSAFKGSCDLSNLQLEEKVLMDLLSFPAWIRINKAVCDQLSIRIPWTKIKSVPIQMNLNEVTVEVEICEEFRDIEQTGYDEISQITSLMNNSQAPSKYGFVDRVIDGITVTVNNILIAFKSKLMSATFNLSRVSLESRCPNWKVGELSLTRIKDPKRGQILLFKIVEWQTMRLEAKCLTDPNQAPLRLITNHAQCRLTIKKNLDDCSVVAARIFVIFEDILWVLTFAQFTSATSFVEYIFKLIKRSPMSNKSSLIEKQSQDTNSSSTHNNSGSLGSLQSNAPPLISPMNTPMHNVRSEKPALLTGNLSSTSLLEQKFLCYDLVETSLHLFIDKIDAHLYDDIEPSSTSASSRDSGGALQTTLDQIQLDCYPYSRAMSDRRHWFKWFDPSPGSRKQWMQGHFAEFDLMRMRHQRASDPEQPNHSTAGSWPGEQKDDFKPAQPNLIALDEQLLSLVVLVKIKDYCMHCVATKSTSRTSELSKFIETDKDYQMPNEMPALYLELNYFYYFDAINRLMVYDNVPEPLSFVHLSPTKLLFDSPTLVFLNSFQVNLSKAIVHLNDLFPEEAAAPKIHCRVEILMPQIILPAKADSDHQTTKSTSSLLVKSGKVTLSSSIYDRNLLSKLFNSIEKLRENPSQPINLGNYHARQGDTCTNDWTRVWNASLISGLQDEDGPRNQVWVVQFEPVWMDFKNFDVAEANGQRLEPIVEPVDAYAFVHLDLSSKFSKCENDENISIKKRDVISILVSVLDGSILANMDKVQFGFLQRLGMHVEKLIQQVKEDASSLIQLETVVEDTLEINLTAYIREIKARLILDKKIEVQRLADGSSQQPVALGKASEENPASARTSLVQSEEHTAPKINSESHADRYNNILSGLKNPFLLGKPKTDGYQECGYIVDDPSMTFQKDNFPDVDQLDECIEVADDASCLISDDSSAPIPIRGETSDAGTVFDQSSSLSMPTSARSFDASSNRLTGASISNSTRLKEDSLLVDLDEIERASNLFAKMDVKSNKKQEDCAKKDSVPATRGDGQQSQQQDIETESISYLELSMSQLMVRRITETKRRQKF